MGSSLLGGLSWGPGIGAGTACSKIGASYDNYTALSIPRWTGDSAWHERILSASLRARSAKAHYETFRKDG